MPLSLGVASRARRRHARAGAKAGYFFGELGQLRVVVVLPALVVVGACLLWALDNNALADASFFAITTFRMPTTVTSITTARTASAEPAPTVVRPSKGRTTDQARPVPAWW